MPELEVYQDSTGSWRWRVRAAGNHEIVAASSEAFSDRQTAVQNARRAAELLADLDLGDPDSYETD